MQPATVAIHHVVRQNVQGDAEFVFVPVTASIQQGMEMNRLFKEPVDAVALTEGVANRGASSLAPYPLSSGDIGNFLGGVIMGVLAEHSLLNFARIDVALDTLLPMYLVGSPVQLAPWAEEIELWRKYVGPAVSGITDTFGNQSRLAMCVSGGGQPNHQVENVIVAEGACPRKFIGSWGCYETGMKH
jgi:hypothetical protein